MKQKVQWIYTGYVVLSDKKLGVSFLTPEDNIMCYSAKRHKGLVIGATYEIEYDEEEQSIYGNFRFVDDGGDNADKLAMWEAQSKAAYNSMQLKKLEEKLKRVNNVDYIMTPLRKAYQNAPYNQKLLIEVAVLNSLRKRV